MPAKVFVSALLDQIAAADVTKERTIKDIETAIGNLPAGQFKQSLTAIFDESRRNLATFKTGLEDWFDQSMVRVSGWYKRYSQKWMFGLGLGLAIGCNVDSVHLLQALSSDPKLRDSLVTQAVDFAKAHTGLNGTNAPGNTPAQSGTSVAAAVKLYELGRLSSGAAAEIAGVPKPLFLSKLADYGVATFDLKKEELQREMALA